MKFTDYCKKNNINLLPEDKKHIRRMLNSAPRASHKAIVRRYVEIWENTRNKCKNPIQSDNEARRAANQWILTHERT